MSKIYRIKQIGQKKYLINSWQLTTAEEHLEYQLNDSWGSSEMDYDCLELCLGTLGELLNDKQIVKIKKRIKKIRKYEEQISENKIIPMIGNQFYLVESQIFDTNITNKTTAYRIKDNITGKYSIGRNKFDAVGKVYKNKMAAEIALTKLSKATKDKRKSKAGKILYTNKHFINCELVPCELKDHRIKI